MVQIIASELRDKEVITNQGTILGNIFDLSADEDTGKIEYLIIDPYSADIANELSSDDEGHALVPASTIVAVRDDVVVDGKKLSASLTRARQRQER